MLYGLFLETFMSATALLDTDAPLRGYLPAVAGGVMLGMWVAVVTLACRGARVPS